jgi:Uma2 family endonuclease
MFVEVENKMSVAELRQMQFDDDDNYFYELIEGEMIRRSAPSTLHQRISGKIYFALETINRSKKLGEIISAPFDVFFDEYNQTQPDLLFISNQNRHILNEEFAKGTPDFIVEIISPTSVLRDRIDKKNLYERMGVQEFWLIDPQYEEIEVFVLENNRYELFSAATSDEGILKSKIFEGLEMNLSEIFN